jgi:RNase adaptor protein for sRNA GlmZ degradation
MNDLLAKMASLPELNEIAQDHRLSVHIYSFAYKKGIPADSTGNGGGYVFDCRSVNNPGKYEYYRQFNGTDPEVIKFLEDDGEVFTFLDSVYKLVDAHAKRFIERKFTNLQVCFGCTGGQHRSVYCAEHLARHLMDKFDIKVTITHRELNIEKML